jgi:hypothetical protein
MKKASGIRLNLNGMRIFLVSEFMFLVVILLAAGYTVEQISIAFPIWAVLIGAFFAKTGSNGGNAIQPQASPPNATPKHENSQPISEPPVANLPEHPAPT